MDIKPLYRIGNYCFVVKFSKWFLYLTHFVFAIAFDYCFPVLEY